jgi:hypothetical protein
LGLKAVFDLPYRMVEGLTGSIVQLLGLALPIPDHTGMSRRAKTLQVQIPRRARTEPIHLVVDSTGLKVYGEGEWKVRQHGAGKRRTWRKVHFAVDAKVKDVVAVEVTTEQWTDGEVFAGLLEQIDEPMARTTPVRCTRPPPTAGRTWWCRLGRMQYRGRPIIRAPRRWSPLPSRGWPAGNGPRVIITGVSRKMPCIASNNCSEIAWLAGNWKRK